MTGPTEEQRKKLAGDHLRFEFESTVDDRISRQMRVRVHEIIPLDFFSFASRERRDMFVAGNFYGCITLVQSVAEGLAKFLAEKNQIHPERYAKLIRKLKTRGVINAVILKAFKAIHGKDRNDFHHLNKRIPQDRNRLEARAEACMNHLYAIESAVFEYQHDGEGAIILVHRKYWPPDDADGMVRVYVDHT